MYRYLFFLALLVLFAPFHALAAPAQATESVQEPDQADEQIPDAQQTSSSRDKKAAKADEQNKDAPSIKKPEGKFESGFNTVILQGLNKVTAHYSKIEAVIGSTIRFGTLEIIARSCWKSTPEERPENAALLEIYEIKQGEPPEKLFLGWMFSSSPGLSSLENPFYDITVVNCAKTETGKL